MLFLNSSDHKLNLDLTAAIGPGRHLRRNLYKDPSKIISKFVDFDESLESERYIGDLSVDEEDIEIGFFDQLKTPSEEVAKGFTPIDENNPLSSCGLLVNNDTVDSRVPTYFVEDEDTMDHDSKPPNHRLHLNHHQNHQQYLHPHQAQQSGNNDSLMTPIIDPNSSLATTGPVFPAVDLDPQNDVFENYYQEYTRSIDQNVTQNQQEDVKPLSFSLAPSPLTTKTTAPISPTPSVITSIHLLKQQQQHQARTTATETQSQTSTYTMASSSDLSNQYYEIPSLPGVSGYNTAHCQSEAPSYTFTPSSSSKPSSSTSSMSYAELKPRSHSFSHFASQSASLSLSTQASAISDSLVPTVIEDHHYPTRNLSSPYSHHPSFSAPSPSPSTSSLASNSTMDRDSTRDISGLYPGDDASNSPYRKRSSKHHHHHHSHEESRKSRMTKKEKLDKMVNEEKLLENENTMLKDKLRVMEHQFKVLQTKITSILVDAAKRKS